MIPRRWILFAYFFACTFAFAFELTNKPKNINETGCECTVVTCCICINETHSKALKVTLKGAGTDLVKARVVLTKCDKNLTPVPVGQDGPRFDGPNGPNISKELTCKDPPVTEEFNINGGLKEGEYKVYIWYEKKDGTKDCEECGTICVFGLPNPAPEATDLTGTLWFPPKSPPFPAPLLPDEAAYTEILANGYEYDGPGCAPGLNTKFTPIATSNFSHVTSTITNQNTGHFVWTPKKENAPGGGQGQKFGVVKDQCGNRLEFWCLPGNFELFFVDCNENYYRIGRCLHPSAYNRILCTYATGCEKRKFRTVELLNQLKNEKRTPVYHFVFDACNYTLSASKKDRDNEGNLPSTPGEKIPDFPLSGPASNVTAPAP